MVGGDQLDIDVLGPKQLLGECNDEMPSLC